MIVSLYLSKYANGQVTQNYQMFPGGWVGSILFYWFLKNYIKKNNEKNI